MLGSSHRSQNDGVAYVLSPLAAELVQNPRNLGCFEGHTHYGVSGIPGEGPYVELWFEVQNGIVRRAGYNTPGCPSSTAAASMLCHLATGREVIKLRELTAAELLAVLGGLPEGKEHYAHKTIDAMKNGLQGSN